MAKHKYIKTPENWKPIKGYLGYEVSNKGRVRSFRKRNSISLYDTPRIIKQFNRGRNNSYLGFSVSNKDGRRNVSTHRCVAEAFISNPKLKLEVNHIDKNGHNNELSNLEWVTSSENKLHAMGENRRPKVCKDRNTFRVHFNKEGSRASKNFKDYNIATQFAETVYL